MQVLKLIRTSPTVKTLDITGGAPEMHPDFRYLVVEARKLGVEVRVLQLVERAMCCCLPRPPSRAQSSTGAQGNLYIIVIHM